MKQFYETYKDEPKLAPLVREIPWTQHRLIIPCKTAQEREFYMRLVRKERLSKREVLHYNLDAIISVGYRVNSKRGKFSFQTQ